MSARTRKPSDVARNRGIVLDAETVKAVPLGGMLDPGGIEGEHTFNGAWEDDWGRCYEARPGDVLTDIGGNHVTELVRKHDKAKADAEWLRQNAGWITKPGADRERLYLMADNLDRLADALIAPALVAAYKAQHPQEAP